MLISQMYPICDIKTNYFIMVPLFHRLEEEEDEDET